MRCVEKTKILIVVERFPPMGGIGSRRWVKFIKYLSRAGYEMHVITRDYPYEDKLNWSNDLDKVSGLNVIRLKSAWPAALMRTNKEMLPRIVRGIICRIGSRIVNSVFFRFYDFSGLWVSKAYPEIRNYIKKRKISYIIISGPPHSNFLLAPLLKSEVDGVKIILDYRDPWVFFKNFLVGSISIQKKLRLISDECLCLSASDRVLFATKPMQQKMSSIYPETSKKYRYIPNVIDPDDYKNLTNSLDLKKQHKTVSLIYFGSVGKGGYSRVPTLVCLANAVQRFNSICDSEVKIMLNVYCEHDERSIIRQLQSGSNEGINIEPPVSRESVSEVLRRNDIGVILNGRHDAHAYSSKIFDYIACGLSLFIVSPLSVFSDELRDMGQYVSEINDDKVMRCLELIVSDFRENKIKHPARLLREFDFSKVGKKLELELRALADGTK